MFFAFVAMCAVPKKELTPEEGGPGQGRGGMKSENDGRKLLSVQEFKMRQESLSEVIQESGARRLSK